VRARPRPRASSFVLTFRNPLRAYEMLYERFKTYVCEVIIIIWITYTKQQIIISDMAIVNIYVGLYTP